MTQYAKGTDVSVEKSKGEIERILNRYGASAFAYGTKPGLAVIQFEAHDRRIRMLLPLPDKNDREFTHYKVYSTWKALPRDKAEKRWEQACRQKWRALSLVVKAKLEAVESGIATFEQEFLSYVVLPNGQTVGEFAIPQIASAYENRQMPPLLPGASE